MLKSRTGLILTFGAALSACGKGKTVSSNYQASTVYFTHGSPLALIAGATRDTEGLLPTADLALYNGFHLMKTSAFVEKSPQSTVSSISEVEEENRTDGSESGVARAVPIYQFSDLGNGRLTWSAANDSRSPVFGFDASGSKIKLTDVNGKAVVLIHYSLKDDHQAFSILIKYAQENSGEVLSSFVFGSIESIQSPVYTSGDYQYLKGFEKIAWDSFPRVSLCGVFDAAVTATLQKSVEAWGADPLAGSEPLALGIDIAQTYPPFSDLNSHCVYVVPSFDLSDSPLAKTLGVNLPSISQTTRKIIDSDVFLFSDLIMPELVTGNASPVAMHEMGHFWGLGHDFRTKADGTALHETIMGYSKGSQSITSWDFAAIRELYNAGFVVAP